MFLSKVSGVAALLLCVGVHADYTIVPDTVPIATRNIWCNDQTSTCPLLCTQYPDGSMTTESNDCDAETLQYSCVCDNGQSPNMTEYSLTIPFHVCREWGQQCIASCGNVNTCQAACTEQHPCGAQDPPRVNVTSTSSTAGATATGSSGAQGTGPVVHNGFADSSTTVESGQPAATNAARAALDLGSSYGLPVVFAGIFAVFGFVM